MLQADGEFGAAQAGGEQELCVLVFPLFWQVDGIWGSLVAAEAMAVCVTLAFLWGKQRVYHY